MVIYLVYSDRALVSAWRSKDAAQAAAAAHDARLQKLHLNPMPVVEIVAIRTMD